MKIGEQPDLRRERCWFTADRMTGSATIAWDRKEIPNTAWTGFSAFAGERLAVQ